jgi:uncharacterized protein (TIGR02611 family)
MIQRAGNLLWRACRVVVGIALVMVGIFLSLPGIPGPGIVVVILGLGLLSSEFHWADRLYSRIKKTGQALVRRAQSKREDKDGRQGPLRDTTSRQG